MTFPGRTGRGLPPAYTPEAETTAWVNQVVADGGTVSALQKYYVDTLLYKPLKAASFLTQIDYLAVYPAENSFQANRDLKGLRLTVPNGSPVFTSKKGYAFSSTNWNDTAFNPSTMASAFTSGNGALGVYEMANVISNGFTASVRDSNGNTVIGIITRLAGGLTTSGYVLNGSTGNVVTPGGTIDSRGYKVVARTTGPAWAMFNNGASIGTYSPSTNGTTMPNHNLYVGGQNNNGAFASGKATSVGLVDVRAALSAPNEAALYAIYQGFMKQMGCAV